ncbi:MAG TPA: xanthine dehydrogenase family protein molybdopterin-binding subunit [Acidimicrobiales bacterium]
MRHDGLLDGRARFAADVPVDRPLHLHFVRSPYAHARITSVHVDAATSMPGVVAVFTAADLDLVPIWEIHLIPDTFGQPPLACDVVRHVGERVVAIVAESLAAAIDASEAVVVEYEPRFPIAAPERALDAPPLFDAHPDNVALRWNLDAGSIDESPDDVVVHGIVEMPRVAVAPMEPLSVLAVPSPGGRLTLHASTQSPHHTRIQTARSLRMDPADVRVVVPYVGGAFGGKALGGIADYVVAAAAARALGRPVRYTEQRSANLTTMHGRGVRLEYTVRADADGRIRLVDVDELCDAGAYPQTNAVEPGKTQMMLCGPYRVPAVRFRARSVLTNRAPSGAYRGPGRSEATAALEQALDAVAQRIGLDPVEVRRRNLLRRDELPLETITGAHYDEVDHHAVLDALLAHARYDDWRAEQRRRRAEHHPWQLGVGLATVVDSTAWFARTETGRVAIDRDGTVRVHTATASAGHQHAVAFARIVRDVLPVGAARIEVVEGDTAEMDGNGTSGSRSLQLTGSVVRRASEVLLARLREHAADLLEAAPTDIVPSGDRFVVRGTPTRGATFVEVVRHAHERGGEKALDARCVFEQETPTYPAAAHLSVVEVDVSSGAVRLLRHVAVTDCGVVVDEPSAHGQVVGACAQGISQVLFEAVSYDEAVTPTNASFAEYLVPSAPDMSSIEANFVQTATVTANPLGAKGVGEIGMVAAPAATWNAVVDALRPFGVTRIDIPCTPERIWRALQMATDGRPAAVNAS